MNKYELTVVVNATVEDDVRAAVIEKVKEEGKKRLAYEIQKMNEAFYYFIHFDAEATCPAEMEAQLRIMDNVLRYLCVRVEE